MEIAPVYKELCQTMAKRGGMYPGQDIPEFYALTQVLFTPDEAAICNAMPRGVFTIETLAEQTSRPVEEIRSLLEAMADKGLCMSVVVGDTRLYGGPPFVPGIFEFQFMRGTSTDRDKTLARLIHEFKSAVNASRAGKTISFPLQRVIPVDRKVQTGTKVHTYDQVATYIEKYHPIAVSTCFCRHEGKLLTGEDCGQPNEVCMQFGLGAGFVAERGLGRLVTKDEAREILNKSEEAGLVHCSQNTQEIDFLCNCCSCHCMIIQGALTQPKPALVLFSGLQPSFDPEACSACQTCIDRCPATALTPNTEDQPALDLDRCFGCGVCVTGCPSEAIAMVARTGAATPPLDKKALKEAMKKADARP